MSNMMTPDTMFDELQLAMRLNEIDIPALSKELEVNMEKALNITGSTSLTNISQMTGGKAITLENVERYIQRLYHDTTDFTVTKLIPEENVSSLMDRFAIKNGTGSKTDGEVSYGTATTELGFPANVDATFVHLIEQSKFLRTVNSMSHVMETAKNSIIKAETELKEDGSLIIAEAAELTNIFGDKAVFPTQYDGLLKIAENINDTGGDLRAKFNLKKDIIVDLRGAALVEGDMLEALETMDENFCTGSHAVMSKSLRTYLDKVELTDSTRYTRKRGDKAASYGTLAGMPVMGLDAANARDNILKFIGNRYLPSGDDTGSKCPSASGGTAPTAPDTVTAAVEADSDSLFLASTAWTGSYWYKVVAVDKDGYATAVAISGAVVVADGEKVTLTINHGSDSAKAPSGFKIYRSEKNAVTADDCRKIGQVAISATTETEYEDLNGNLPATAKQLILDLPKQPRLRGISYRKLLPFFRMPIYFGYNGVFGWSYAYGKYGYLRVNRPSIIVIKNIAIPGHGF